MEIESHGFEFAHDVLEDNPDGDSSILEYISRSHVEVDISVYPLKIITPDGKENGNLILMEKKKN